MRPMACVDIAALPLQLLLRDEPAWRGWPAAVITEDTPQGQIVAVNARAARERVRPGMRLGAALSLTRDLRARVVPPAQLAAAREAIVARLQRLAPQVEVRQRDPRGGDRSTPGATAGVFWVRADGLQRVAPSREAWAHALREALGELGLEASVVVGFTRFGTHAVARGLGPELGPAGRVKIFARPQDERAAADLVPLAALVPEELPPRRLEDLAKLGVRRVGDLVRLSAAGLRRRLGPEVYGLCLRARGAWDTPLAAAPEVEPLRAQALLEPPERDRTRLLFVAKGLLGRLGPRLEAAGQVPDRLTLTLRLTDDPPVETTIQAAEPTRAHGVWLDLVRLRLEGLTLPSPVDALAVTVAPAPAPRDQLTLFAARPPRDPAVAEQALARLRAELGAQAVTEAALRDGHLPEETFAFPPRPPRGQGAEGAKIAGRPLKVDARAPSPGSAPGGGPPLRVRRVRAPVQAPAPDDDRGASHARHGDEVEPPSASPGAPWLPLGPKAGPVVAATRTTRLSSGWWEEAGGADRLYRGVTTADGRSLWLAFDRRHRRWSVAGAVE